MKELIKNAVEKNRLCAASFIYKKDSEYHELYEGQTSYFGGVKVNEETLYDCASVSKVIVTNTLILKLLSEGHFQLETKVQDILSAYPHKDTTIEDLLLHRSGLPADNESLKALKSRYEFEEELYRTQLIYKPGDKIVYSDLGYILLGWIIEHFYGPLDLAAKKYIFDPLGMENSYYIVPKQLKSTCAATEFNQNKNCFHQGEVHDVKTRILGGVSGAAGLFSTAKDLEKFVKMLLDNQELVLSLESKSLLKETKIRREGVGRGYGFIKEAASLPESNNLYHTGFTGTSIYLDLDNSNYFILLTNRVHPHRENTAIFDIRDDILKTFRDPEFVLASASPRRHELFRRISNNFIVVPADVMEETDSSLTVDENIINNAYKKAQVISKKYPDQTVIGADTVIDFKGEIIGKPKDLKDAYNIIDKLQGEQHLVKTAVVIMKGDQSSRLIETTEVSITDMTHETIVNYLKDASILDKSGAYAIQGEMSKFISKIEGDINNVIGLPVQTLYKHLMK